MRVLLCLVLLSAPAFADEPYEVEPGVAQISSDSDREMIREHVRLHLPKLQLCYEKQQLANPGLAGKVDIRFTIEATGKVSSATASLVGGTPLVALGKCAADTIKTIVFDKPTKAVVVSYPFVFQPSGAATPTGGSDDDRAMFRRVVRRHLPRLQACYEKELDKHPTLAGTVTAKFTVEADGKVSKASAAGVDPAVATCVANVIKLVAFDKPSSKTLVSYPFVFRSSAPPGPTTTGTDEDKMMVRRFIKGNIAKIQLCYEKELKKQPDLAGTVTVSFMIDSEGKVTAASGSGVDGTVAMCVAEIVKGIQFDKPSKLMQINYPFVFRPASP